MSFNRQHRLNRRRGIRHFHLECSSIIAAPLARIHRVFRVIVFESLRSLFNDHRHPELFQTSLGNIQNAVTAGRVIRHTLQEILNRRDYIRQGIHFLPVRTMLSFQQAVTDIQTSLLKDGGRTLQTQNRKAATHGRNQTRNAFQVHWIPLRGNVLNDGILRFL